MSLRLRGKLAMPKVYLQNLGVVSLEAALRLTIDLPLVLKVIVEAPAWEGLSWEAFAGINQQRAAVQVGIPQNLDRQPRLQAPGLLEKGWHRLLVLTSPCLTHHPVQGRLIE